MALRKYTVRWNVREHDRVNFKKDNPPIIESRPIAISVDSFEPKLPIEIFPLEPSSITEPAKTNSAIQTNVHHALTFPISTCQTKFQAEFTDRPPNAFELPTKPPDKAAELELPTKPPDKAAELELPTKPPDKAAELELLTKPPENAAELELPTKPPDIAAELELPTKPPDKAAELELPTKPPDKAAELELPSKPPDKATELELPSKPPIDSSKPKEPPYLDSSKEWPFYFSPGGDHIKVLSGA